LPPPILCLTSPTSSTFTTHWIVYYTKFTHYPQFPIPLQSLTQAPSLSTTEPNLNTQKGPNNL
jgi:hypothetical protein